MRLLSVALTEQQVRERTKTVTRRLGWLPGKMVNPGDRLCLVRKAMGRKRSDGTVEPLVRLATVSVVAAHRERLDTITADDVAREGFPDWTPSEFVEFFTKSMRCQPDDMVTRIEFRYIDPALDVLDTALNAIDEAKVDEDDPFVLGVLTGAEHALTDAQRDICAWTGRLL